VLTGTLDVVTSHPLEFALRRAEAIDGSGELIGDLLHAMRPSPVSIELVVTPIHTDGSVRAPAYALRWRGHGSVYNATPAKTGAHQRRG
jgi:hypothetical protein